MGRSLPIMITSPDWPRSMRKPSVKTKPTEDHDDGNRPIAVVAIDRNRCFDRPVNPSVAVVHNFGHGTKIVLTRTSLKCCPKLSLEKCK